MEYDSVLDQQSISGINVSLILCVWKPGYMKSGHISFLVSHEMQNVFLKFRAPHKGPDETFYLARSHPELL